MCFMAAHELRPKGTVSAPVFQLAWPVLGRKFAQLWSLVLPGCLIVDQSFLVIHIHPRTVVVLFAVLVQSVQHSRDA